MENESPIKLTPAQRGRMLGLIKRLESGKYKQVKATLQFQAESGEIYNCCLGVACRMLVESKMMEFDKSKFESKCEIFDENRNLKEISGTTFYSSVDDSKSSIAKNLESLFGFNSNSGDFREWQSTYWRMNDEQEKSFEEIATELRKNFGFRPRKQVAK